MKGFSVRTCKRVEFIDITSEVEKLVKDSRIKEGICCVFVPHTTCGLTINENADPAVSEDIINHLSKLIPYPGDYSHLEGNADAHLKASFMGNSLNIIVEASVLQLGRWQGIYLCEFDGPRRREVWVKIMGR